MTGFSTSSSSSIDRLRRNTGSKHWKIIYKPRVASFFLKETHSIGKSGAALLEHHYCLADLNRHRGHDGIRIAGAFESSGQQLKGV
jgi:hypothetical protein